MADDDKPYLIWSNEHRAWWEADGHGYTKSLAGAGRFSRVVALTICQKAIPGTAARRGLLPELPVLAADVLEMEAGFLSLYGDQTGEPWR